MFFSLIINALALSGTAQANARDLDPKASLLNHGVAKDGHNLMRLSNHNISSTNRNPLAFVTQNATVATARGTSYEDNVVKLPFNAPDYTLDHGSFEVRDLAITDGSDPEGRNYIGQILKWDGAAGTISWSIGRTKTEKVAQFWTKYIPAGSSTFNHDPSELNFAFYGDMTLSLRGGVFDVLTDFTITGAAIAQGSKFTSNNWWFGCKGGENLGDHKVRCTAKSGSGQALNLIFRRGGWFGSGSSVKEISLEAIEDLQQYTMFAMVPDRGGEHESTTWQDSRFSPPYVIYYTPQQAEPLKIKVGADGLLCDSNNILFDTTEDYDGQLNGQAAIFVLDPKGTTLYASRQSVKYLFHHSTFLAGGNVTSAGEMFVRDGVIEWMSNTSGHYRPSKVAYDQFKQSLWNKGYRREFEFKPFT